MKAPLRKIVEQRTFSSRKGIVFNWIATLECGHKVITGSRRGPSPAEAKRCHACVREEVQS